MVYLLAAASALTSAVAGILQRIGVEAAPAGDAMRLRLLTHALRRGIWLAGFGLLLVTFVLQATALRFGTLAVVQPVLTTELLFLIGILAVFFHRHLGWHELVGAFAIVVGLAGFLALAAPAIGKGIPDSKVWGIVTVVIFVASAILVAAGLRGPRWWRAAAFGASAAVLFAYNAALTKATTTLITGGWGHVFTHWESYALGATGLLGFFMLQNALHAGPIASAKAMMVIVNPLVSIVLGVFVFDEHLRSGAGFITSEVLALTVMCAGGFLLSQSPLVAGSTELGAQGEMLRAPAPVPALEQLS
jgi:drug/metabolite transporter (DMT)-like permease